MISSKLAMTSSIRFYIRPGAAESRVEGVYKDRIKVRINAPPEKGKANKELIKFISKILLIPKSRILITSGKTSNYKEIQINSGNSKDYYNIILNHSINNL
jgi:uncharacterized protein